MVSELTNSDDTVAQSQVGGGQGGSHVLPMTPVVRLSLPGRRVCFWGAPSESNPQHGQSTSWRVRLEDTGGNTGNLFIGNGLFNATDAALKAYHPGFGTLPASFFDEEFDTLFIPASNFVNPALDLQHTYDYFKRTRTSMFCFGLGSQVIPGSPVVLKPGTEAFLRLLSERCNTIGVRGAFTADILWSLGIRNISLTGCPSLLGLDDKTLTSLVAAKPSLNKLAVNFSNNVRRHSFNPDAQQITENSLFSSAIEINAFYILQNEATELSILDALETGDRESQARHAGVMASIFDCAQDLDNFRTFMQTRLRVFYSTRQWIAAMQTMTATVGTRFHGNIASILGGKPGLVLVHDMRTLELAELFCIPHLILDRGYSGEEVLERLQTIDYVPFARRLGQLRAEWRLFAQRNGISCKQADYD